LHVAVPFCHPTPRRSSAAIQLEIAMPQADCMNLESCCSPPLVERQGHDAWRPDGNQALTAAAGDGDDARRDRVRQPAGRSGDQLLMRLFAGDRDRGRVILAR
jgi:hypothetical protein